MNDHRVLIAETDDYLRRRLSQKLLDRDIFSDCVADGRHALQVLTERSYGIVLIDLDLPGVDAVRVIDNVAAIPMAHRPITIVTASHGRPHNLDADAVQILLRKPFDATQVAEIIANCLHSLTVRAQSQPTSSPAARKASQAPENESARVRT